MARKFEITGEVTLYVTIPDAVGIDDEREFIEEMFSSVIGRDSVLVQGEDRIEVHPEYDHRELRYEEVSA
jgi:hypothetical protein